MVRRATARPGEALFVSGSLGDAALGLALRKDPALADRWEPHAGRGRASARAATCGRNRASASGRRCASTPPPPWTYRTGSPRTWRACARRAAVPRACVSSDVPLSPAAAKALAADPALARSIVAAGDDYEVLAAVPAASADAYQAMAAQAGIAVTRIGTTLAGTGIVIEGRDGQPLALDRPGWDHF